MRKCGSCRKFYQDSVEICPNCGNPTSVLVGPARCSKNSPLPSGDIFFDRMEISASQTGRFNHYISAGFRILRENIAPVGGIYLGLLALILLMEFCHYDKSPAFMNPFSELTDPVTILIQVTGYLLICGFYAIGLNIVAGRENGVQAVFCGFHFLLPLCGVFLLETLGSCLLSAACLCGCAYLCPSSALTGVILVVLSFAANIIIMSLFMFADILVIDRRLNSFAALAGSAAAVSANLFYFFSLGFSLAGFGMICLLGGTIPGLLILLSGFKALGLILAVIGGMAGLLTGLPVISFCRVLAFHDLFGVTGTGR
ncbi:MAG: hypothetical protein PHW04_16445 [Candidatus Wallbacteria bacterium]|nr:hypothetical protein [Candidatus Wallbacteria bacterium]